MDIENLLRLLNENSVDYVVIGATAFPTHGYSRATLDIDLFIRKTEENARQVWLALQKFGYDVTDLSVEDLLNFKILIRQYVLETDIHPFVAGVTFEDVWKNKVTDKIGNTEANFAGLDDLIKMKKAANRPKDQEDIKVLEEIKNRKGKT